MTGAIAHPTPMQSVAELVGNVPGWVRRNVVTIAITAVISGVVAYGVNVWLMAVRYEGAVTPQGAPATSRSNFFAGGLFWAVFPMLVCSLVGYWRSVGNARFWRDVRRLPMTLIGLFRRGGTSGRVHLLWGAALALAASIFVPPAVGAVLGIGLLVSAPSVVGSIVSSLGAQVWRALARVVAPTKDHRVPPVLKVAVGLLGWGVALVAGFVLPGQWIRLVLALSCAVAAFVIGRRPTRPAAIAGAVAVVLLLAVAYVVADVVLASSAMADDGGFAECGSTLSGWISRCSGADTVRQLSLLGAVIAAVAGPVGYVLGGALGTLSPRPGGGHWWDDPALGGAGDGDVRFRTDWPPRPDGLPTGPRDPSTGEPLVVNDGRWADAPVGHVYAGGSWVHPEAIGAVDRPLVIEPALDDVGPAVAGWLWLPPLVAASVLGLPSARGAVRDASSAGGGGGGSEGAAVVDEVRAIRARLDDPALDDATRLQLHVELRAKAIAIEHDPVARRALAADTSGAAEAVAAELERVYDEVEPRFLDRINGLGVRRADRPLDVDDLWDLREQAGEDVEVDDTDTDELDTDDTDPDDPDGRAGPHGQARRRAGLSAGAPTHGGAHGSAPSMRSLWKRNTRKKKKSDVRNARLAIDVDTYRDFLVQRLRIVTSDAEQAAIQAKMDRLDAHRANGVTSVMVSATMWNDLAQHAYSAAYYEATGTEPVLD